MPKTSPNCESHLRCRPLSARLMLVLAIAFGVIDFVSGSLAAQTRNSSEPSVHSAHTQFLVLKTGSVYSGQLEFSGSKYIVLRPTGAAIKFNAAEVDFVCQTLDEGYLRLASRVRPSDLLGQQRLTNWCLKNRLITRAQHQLDVLKQLAPNSAMTRLVERQLESITNPSTDLTLTNDSSNKKTEIRQLPKAKNSLASHVELRDRVNSFSDQSLREFNRTIHPRIVNGCAAARCHGDTNRNMRLWRVDNRGGIGSTGVQRNLYAISEYLDRENPLESELLKYVSEIHGGMEAAAYSKDSHHYHAIRDWVINAGNRDNSALQSITDISQTSFLNKPEADGQTNSRLPEQSAEAQNQKDWPTLPGFEDDLPSPVNLNNSEKQFVPKDEFDPEIFNRKYTSLSAQKRRQSNKTASPIDLSTKNRSLQMDPPSTEPPPASKPATKIRSLPKMDDN